MNRHLSIAALALLGACQDLTAPAASSLTPRAVIPWTEGDAPRWLPNSEELLYVNQGRLDAFRIADGARRTVIPARPAGEFIVRAHFFATSAFVYFEISQGSGGITYRARIGDTVNVERVLVQQTSPTISADDRMAAWTEPGTIVTVNTITAEVRRISAPVWYGWGEEFWEPQGRGLALVSLEGASVIWYDVASGTIRSWTPPSGLHLEEPGTRTIAWSGTGPVLYALRGNTLTRYVIATNQSEDLGTADGKPENTSWSADGSAFSYWNHECIHRSTDFFGTDGCDRSAHTLTVLHWSEHRKYEAEKYIDTGAPWEPYFTGARFSPDGAYLMFGQQRDSPEDGYFVRRAR